MTFEQGRDLEEITHREKADEFEHALVDASPKMYGIAYEILRNPSYAEEAVDIASLKGWEAFYKNKFERRSTVTTWLCTIARNTAYDIARANKRKKAISLSDVEENHPLQPLSRERRSERFHESVEMAIAELPEKQREVLVMYAHNGLMYKEIAKELEISLGTVMSRLHYARQNLRPLLIDLLDDVDKLGINYEYLRT